MCQAIRTEPKTVVRIEPWTNGIVASLDYMPLYYRRALKWEIVDHLPVCLLQMESRRRVSVTEKQPRRPPLPREDTSSTVRVQPSVSTCPAVMLTELTNPCSVTPAWVSAGASTRPDRRSPDPEPSRAADPCVRAQTGPLHTAPLYDAAGNTD